MLPVPFPISRSVLVRIQIHSGGSFHPKDPATQPPEAISALTIAPAVGASHPVSCS
jgi:hypothetical protein